MVVTAEISPATSFPGSTTATWQQHRSLLEPDFFEVSTNTVRAASQVWLLRSEGRNIVVDTGFAHTQQPGAQANDTDLIQGLTAAGVRREDNDVVINTHLHEDHVGWNTYLDGGVRVPSFPNLAPGHTPGSSILRLQSGSDTALFVGDALHTPLQIVQPDTNSQYCEDPTRARRTRNQLLGQAADTNALVLPAHFPGHGAAEIERNGN
ncbi:MBL fold metallo-hydrolase [Nocardia iowensis]|uniref:MBL fold metallo-hydrolase n=1 Tax=Nocardia iowensis TaxID=204891 RepID=UPI0031E601E1